MNPDKHVDHEYNVLFKHKHCTIYTKWILVIKTAFPLCWENHDGCNVTVTLRWIYLRNTPHTRQFKSLSQIFKDFFFSCFSTCSDSELPALGLFTFRSLLNTLMSENRWRFFNLVLPEHRVSGANLATTCILIHKSNKKTAHDCLVTLEKLQHAKREYPQNVNMALQTVDKSQTHFTGVLSLTPRIFHTVYT